MRRLTVLLAAALVLAALTACGSDDKPATVTPTTTGTAVAHAPCGSETPAPAYDNLPTITFGSSSQALRVEVADEAGEQHVGLMNRECLGDDWGMIFVYGGDVQTQFWMQNTYIPLTIAFIAGDGTILHIEDMEPLTESLHHSPEPYQFAIEANQGWYAEHGINVGDKASIPASIIP